MQWLVDLVMDGGGLAHTAILFSIVIAAGVFLGNRVKICGISFGVTWILFMGILVGYLLHVGMLNFPYSWKPENVEVISFVQEFGLVLFVFSIGLQVGPSFFTSLRKGGLKANGVAAGIVMLNILVMLILYYALGRTGIVPEAADLPMMVGTLCGAVTNTPGLGAANSTLEQINQVAPIANGYACAYPLGVLGIIGSIALIKVIFKIDFKKELDHFNKRNSQTSVKPKHITICVKNPAIDGKSILNIRNFIGRNFVISRLLHQGHISVPNRNTILHLEDKVFCVCAEEDAEPILAFIGPQDEVAWDEQDVAMTIRKLTVSEQSINGRTLGSLHPSSIYGVNVTRIYRSGIEILASPSTILQVGDMLRAVGPEDAVDRFAMKVGDKKQHLDKPNLITLFFGIFVGVLFGMIPIAIPGISIPVKLGIAGGPLIVAILLGRFGYKFKLVAYTTNSASLMIRDMGLALFLAGVGIKAGDNFVDTVINGGYHFVWMGFLITVIPLLIAGIFARSYWKMNYFLLMGVMSGATTDPPALAYSTAVADNSIPSVGYSTVYPLSMFLRIVTAQVIILAFCA